LNLRLEEINGEPRAILEGAGEAEEALLPHFLHPAPHFVADVLYEISLVERLVVESSGFETDLVDVKVFSDQVIIKFKLRIDVKGKSSSIVLSLDEAKLMLLEWGAMLQRWRIERKKAG
jgi:hypothetical protein